MPPLPGAHAGAAAPPVSDNVSAADAAATETLMIRLMFIA